MAFPKKKFQLPKPKNVDPLKQFEKADAGGNDLIDTETQIERSAKPTSRKLRKLSLF